ncbi:MAG: Hsp20/alpha crystallin family protein [Lawsonibacter sp.]|nr:Hsp20/alpha crystallin family protein [Lawsonibacter sp.]
MLTPYLMAKNMLDELAESAFSANTLRGMMNTDIKESDQGYELDIDLPGVHKEDLSAELKDGYLCISATVEQTHNDSVQNERYLRRERFIGSCRRSFYVGDKVKQEDIHAKFEDGILRLFIPKVSQVAQIEQKNLIAIEG